ncbi:putative F-box-like domain superfamily protein [Helianthus anomalus]
MEPHIAMSLKPHKKMKMKVELSFSLIEFEILSRLAEKSDIGCCRCVCKQWKSFLSTPAYARMHLQHHQNINDYKLLIFDEFTFRTLDGSTTIPSHPNPNLNPNHIFIFSSLHGLVCLGSKESTQLVFWNPFHKCLQEVVICPRFTFSNKYARDGIGFYTDSSSDDKLICVIGGGGLDGAHIYSHRLDSWREIEFPFVSTTKIAYTLDVEGEWWIICFDVKTKTFKKILFPPVPVVAMDRGGSFVLLNGCIHLCVTYKITTYLKLGDL